MSEGEFLLRWDAGDFEDSDDPAITRVAMLIPFCRAMTYRKRLTPSLDLLYRSWS
jgi:hypothetical protein